MPRSYWDIVNSVIAKSDILLMVLDARLVDETNNPEIEARAKNAGKDIIYVLNKCDLVARDKLLSEKKKFWHCVFLSATKHFGTNLLREEIMKLAGKDKVTVGVLGYPNTGKSSVINALCGAGGAKVAPMPGHTRAVQLLKASNSIYMLDTPGVLPFGEDDEIKHLIIGSKSAEKAKDPESAAITLLQQCTGRIKEWYGIEPSSDGEKMLDDLAAKLNLIKKGGAHDTRRASVRLLHDWQRGRIF